MLNLAVFILAILYLCGVVSGTTLAICAMVLCVLNELAAYARIMNGD